MTNHNPDIVHNVGGLGQWIPTSELGPLFFVPSPDLIKGSRDDCNSKNRVEVVLRWAASEGGPGLERVDYVADDDLNDVEDEKRESSSLNHGSDHMERSGML